MNLERNKEKLSENFTRGEFACKCGCGFDLVDEELVEVLQDVRNHFGKPVRITSGCRCAEHNRKVGGASGSKHLVGIAADIRIYGVKPSVILEYLENKYPDTYGLAMSEKGNFVHVDTRRNKARWSY